MNKTIEIDEEALAARGVQNFLNGYNCSQAVVAAFADLYGLDDKIVGMASSFGGGMGRLQPQLRHRAIAWQGFSR